MSKPALCIEGLRFAYPGTDPVIDIERLEIAGGEQVLLTGGSGTGKSTLLQLIAGLLDPESGTVGIGGESITSMSPTRRDGFRGRSIGMIFQTFNLLHGFSALENVMAALMFSTIPGREHKQRAAELLNRLGIDEIHKECDRLSVGQQQRVAVARAVACDPVLVLADEPTASLDPENAEAAVALIQDTCRQRGAALLCTSHDPAMVDRFERSESLAQLTSVA